MKKKIYLAGAMGCYGENQEIPKAWRRRVIEWFDRHSDGFECIDPSDYFEYGKALHHTESEPMRFDLYKVTQSDVVLVNMENLRESLGTSDEILMAYLKGIPIVGFYTTDNYTDLKPNEYNKVFHPWKVEQINRIEVGPDAMENALMYVRKYYA